MKPLRRLFCAAGLLWLASCAAPPPVLLHDRQSPALPASASPEIATGLQRAQGGFFHRQAVAAAQPLAADAGLAVLRAGGNAVDAAVAVQMVLALVEPQSSGIGGGSFLLLWDGHEVSAWDGRETAPAAADERLLLRADGQPLPFAEAMVGGRAVGVPGTVRVLEAVHLRHGRLPWARLFEPAIQMAEQGFAVGPRLHAQLASDAALRRDPLASALYYRADGSPHPVGQVLRNPALAAVLRAIAAQGSAALHQGPVAADVVARVRAHARSPGLLTAADLAGYRPQQRAALCADWRRWRICGMPPPSSGQLALMQILKLLDHTGQPLHRLDGGSQGDEALHRYAEAARLAFADRAAWVADPAFVAAPAGRWDSLLDDDYLRTRAALIGARRLDPVPPGQPRGAALTSAPMPAQPEWGTTHVSIVDADGRALAMTSSVEAQFGARLMSDGGTGLPGGFLLNNQLTDFSFTPADGQGRAVANRVQADKRPRSTMAPTLVFDRASGEPVLAVGSSGGATIVHHVARTLLAMLDEGVDAQAALARPHVVPIDAWLVLERGGFAPAVADALRARGHTVQQAELTSGLQLLMRSAGGWVGAADPRREGVVRGD